MSWKLGIGWSRERKELSIKLTQKTKKYLSVIQEAKESGNLAIFVGAGFSVSENNKKYKSWSGVTKKLIKELNCNKNLDNLKIAELYKLQFGKAKLKQAVLQSFPKTPDVAGTLHKELVNLNPHYIITTNWDKLIDDAIEKTTNIYDIIVNDNELVKSVNNSKYIKMHGDFEHDNFVYAESDYLNYSANFPLIENFLKSIFSTHVIVLLGYSFNDMDLKQIVSWVKDNSKERLPIYMITTSPKDTAELNYLGKYGIKAFQICNTNNLSKPSFIEFFKLCDKYNPLNYSHDPCAFLVNKLMPLNDYRVILLSQVKDVLTNCCIMYENGLSSALSFYDKVASFDYDENTRICYRNFLNNALKYNKENNKHKPQIDYIISILKRADIHGICDDGMIKNTINLTFDVNGPELYDNYSSRFNFDYKTKKYTNNSEMLDLIFSLYSIEQYEKAFTLTNDLIHKSKKENNFIYTFISYFNYNILIRKLKFEYFKEQQKRDFYRQLQLIDIDYEYNKLPPKFQRQVFPIYSLINFEKLYVLNYKSQDSIEQCNSKINILVKNGRSEKEVFGHKIIHKNLVDFIVNNGICFEEYEEYKKVNYKYLLLSQINQQDKSKWNPNKTELYSSIKYFDFKDIQDFFKFYKEGKKQIEISEILRIWLIKDVLQNCANNYINKKNTMFSHLEKYIDNCLYILSLLELTKAEITTIINQICKIVVNVRNQMSIFESIELFFVNQFSLFGGKNVNGKPALKVFECLITKLSEDKCNFYEVEALLRYKLINVCNIGIQNSVKFSNDNLLIKLLNKIDGISEQKRKYEFIERIVMIIYQMSDESCKKIIDKYISALDLTQDKDSYEYISFMLSLKHYKFGINDEELRKSINNHIDFFSKNEFSSTFNGLKSGLDAVCKIDNSYSDLLEKINMRIQDYEKFAKQLNSVGGIENV